MEAEDTIVMPKKQPTKFQPGSGKVHIKLTQEKRAGAELNVRHDERVIARVVNSFANATHMEHEMRSHDPDNQEEWYGRCLRMVNLVVAKKLATSLSPRQRLAYGANLGAVSKMEMTAPMAIVSIADGLGYVEEKDYDVIIAGQPFLAFTYAARALATDAGINRDSDWFINRAWVNAREAFFEFARASLWTWADESENVVIQVGAQNLSIKVPRVDQGFGAFQQMFAGAPRPPWVDRVLQVATLVENVWPPDQPTLVALAAQGVRVVNWGRTEYVERLDAYGMNVQSRVEGTLSSIMSWGTVRTMKMVGASWQLLREGGGGVVTCPVRMSGQDLEFGAMLGGLVGYTLQPELYTTLSSVTAKAKMEDYIRQAIKKKF